MAIPCVSLGQCAPLDQASALKLVSGGYSREDLAAFVAASGPMSPMMERFLADQLTAQLCCTIEEMRDRTLSKISEISEDCDSDISTQLPSQDACDSVNSPRCECDSCELAAPRPWLEKQGSSDGAYEEDRAWLETEEAEEFLVEEKPSVSMHRVARCFDLVSLATVEDDAPFEASSSFAPSSVAADACPAKQEAKAAGLRRIPRCSDLRSLDLPAPAADAVSASEEEEDVVVQQTPSCVAGRLRRISGCSDLSLRSEAVAETAASQRAAAAKGLRRVSRCSDLSSMQ